MVAERKIQLAATKVVLLQQRINDTELRAPFDGTVLEVLKRSGEGLSEGSTAEPVLLFADVSALHVRAEVDERFVREIRPGQSVRLFGKILGGNDYTGSVHIVFSQNMYEEKNETKASNAEGTFAPRNYDQKIETASLRKLLREMARNSTM